MLNSKNIKKNYSKYFVNLFLLIYIIFGLYYSTQTGISHDEFGEQYNWKINIEAVKGLFVGDQKYYDELLNYKPKYYGIGFHFISQVYINLFKFILLLENFSLETTKILINHSLIFIFFFISGLYSKKIIDLSIKNNFFSNLFLFFYLLYPYLLGHGFYNSKDTPFLTLWIMCTYFSLKIFLNINSKKKIKYREIIILSFLTAYLLSIRISGIMIFIQYLSGFLILVNLGNNMAVTILKENFIKIILFFTILILLTYAFYPVFWKNPFLIVEAINQMKAYPQGVCTLTFGKCMKAVNLPSSYIFLWLAFKLPMLTLLGIAILIFSEKKIFIDNNQKIIVGSILVSIISIIFLLIFFDVNLYDELRQILFLIPLIIIIAFISLYAFSKKILIIFSALTIFIFIIQNILIYPYQYGWFNSFSLFTNLNSKFELDYWGVGGRNIANKINNSKQILEIKNKCIYSAPEHLLKPFLNEEFACVKPLKSIYPSSKEKYILAKFTRTLRRDNPSNCLLVINESYNILPFSEKLNTGEVFICN